MPSKPKPEGDLPATAPGLKPGDFALGSAESRAAARAKVQALEKLEGPQPGDIHLDWSDRPQTPEEQAGLAALYSRASVAGKADKRIPGIPVFWITFPDWFVPESTDAVGN